MILRGQGVCKRAKFFWKPVTGWIHYVAFVLNQTKVAVSPPKFENRFPNFFQATQIYRLDRVAAFTNRGLHRVV